MLKFLRLGVLKRGVQTKQYPQEKAELYSGTMGLPVIDAAKCDRCGQCVSACPVQAISLVQGGVQLSLESCIFCSACADACPSAITISNEFELAAKNRDQLKVVYRHG